jgi:hypothetical protein
VAETDQVIYAEALPEWDPERETYVDPDTGEPLSSWDEAIDAIRPDDGPGHVLRFGTQIHAKGVLAGNAARCIGYLAKYLTKSIADCHPLDTDAQRQHADRLVEALQYFRPATPSRRPWGRVA